MRLRRWSILVASVVVAALTPPRAAGARPRAAARAARDTPSARPPVDRWALTGGFLETLSLPERNHLGLYAFAGAARVMPRGSVVLLPGLGVEAAVDTGRWGLVASLTVDIPVSDRVGLDLGAALLTDQPGMAFGRAVVSGGIGPGVSFAFGIWTLSPSVSVFGDLVGGRSWQLVPALQLSRVL